MKEKILEAFRNWNPEMSATVKIKFITRGDNNPLTGKQYMARLYDKDVFTDDDYLGHSGLNDKGEAHIHFFPSDVFNSDLGFETLPDLYVLLFDGDIVHHQTNVWENVDLEKLSLLDMKEGEVINFGTFIVD